MMLYTLLKRGFKKFRRSSWNDDTHWCLDSLGYMRSVHSGIEEPVCHNVSKYNLLAKDWEPVKSRKG